MDDIEDFFNLSNDFKREIDSVPLPILEPGPSTSRQLKRECDSKELLCKKIPKLEPKLEDKHSDVHRLASKVKRFPEDFMDDEDDEPEEKYSCLVNDYDIYRRYEFNADRVTALPIQDSKDEILKTIRKNPVVILQGDTGCGKTTQVPQYLLDEAYTRSEYCKIVCTQPRRIAAMSISKRVCAERNWKVGDVVGFQVGLHSQMSKDTLLLYCTTGVLLQKLIRDKSLLPFTHIILDEVHERDQNMDFLLIIIRRLLLTNSKNVKIILMSATIDTKEFSEYFRIRKRPAPVIKADTRRLFLVKEFYLCDLASVNSKHAKINPSEPDISLEMYRLVLKLFIVIRDLENDESSIDSEANNSVEKASILIFLPGMNEIDRMYKMIDELCRIRGENIFKMCCARLHSVISPAEQAIVFRPAPPGCRKVILATNIAESSITVPDVKYVIDSCLTKLLVTDTTTNFTSLQLNWASKANCRQRAGRAGRVMNGRVYRLVPRAFFENVLDEFIKPEMLRCPLENIVLKAKLLDMGSPPEILSLALSPPNLSHIQNTILTLKELGGLYKTTNGIYTIDDGDISYVGRMMAILPLDVRLTRLIVFGYIFDALEDSIIMAAGLSVRSIFKSFAMWRAEEEAGYLNKMEWADGTGSDLIAIIRAYKAWVTLPDDTKAEQIWADINMMNLRSLREMHLLIRELKGRISAFGIKQRNISEPPEWLTWEKAIVIKLIIAGAFYPNYILSTKLHDPDKERKDMNKIFCRDLCRTVYFTNFDTSHIGQLYIRSVKDIFEAVNINTKNIDVYFQSNSERVLVIFKDNFDQNTAVVQYDAGRGSSSSRGRIDKYRSVKTPGSVVLDLYKALRVRYLKLDTTINVMEANKGRKYAEAHGIGEIEEGVWVPTRRLANNGVVPSVFEKYISGTITHIETCSKFYFKPLHKDELVNEIREMLNNPFDIEDCKFPDPKAVAHGMILAARFEELFYRGKVMNIICQFKHSPMYEIWFMDFGNTAVINFEDLRYLSVASEYLNEIPPTVLKCRLAMIEPSLLKSPYNQWTDEAMEYIQQHTDSGTVQIEVFSVVDGVSNVKITKDNSTINDILVAKGLARTSDESFTSKTDHDRRVQKQSVQKRFNRHELSIQNEEYLRSIRLEVDVDVEPPPLKLCTERMTLAGPFSPLESHLISAIRASSWKSVLIERDSVNFMNIDSDPNDMYERLIVAADISEGQKGRIFVARNTTKMPNMHGFGALMTMLFCQTLQIKRNMKKTKYVAVLAGLGFDEETYKPLYGEHDIVLNLDVNILQNDIDLINQIRMSMDTLLYTNLHQCTPNNNSGDVKELKTKIKVLLLRLLSKQRKYVEIHVHPYDVKWEKFDRNEIVETTALHGSRSLFPPLQSMRLYEEDFNSIHILNTHCHELHNLRQFDEGMKPTKCRLCDITIDNVVQLRVHLLSQLHRDREQQIRFRHAPL